MISEQWIVNILAPSIICSGPRSSLNCPPSTQRAPSYLSSAYKVPSSPSYSVPLSSAYKVPSSSYSVPASLSHNVPSPSKHRNIPLSPSSAARNRLWPQTIFYSTWSDDNWQLNLNLFCILLFNRLKATISFLTTVYWLGECWITLKWREEEKYLSQFFLLLKTINFTFSSLRFSYYMQNTL